MSAPWGDSPVFAATNWLDDEDATVTCAGEDADYPALNLLEDDASQLVFWTEDDDPANTKVVYDLGATRDVDVLVETLCNYTEDSDHTIEGSANGSDWTTIEGEFGGFVDERPGGGENRRHFIFLADSTQSYRYFRHSISDASNPDERVGASRAFLSPALQSAISQAWGHQWGAAPADVVERTPGGVQHRRASGRPRTLDIRWEWLTEDEAMEDFFEQLDLALGLAATLVVILQPDDPTTWWRNALWCFATSHEPVSPPEFGQWSKGGSFEEVIP